MAKRRKYWENPPPMDPSFEFGTGYVAPSLTNADIFQTGAALGMTRSQVRAEMVRGIHAGAIPRTPIGQNLEEARSWLMQQHAPGYEQHLENLLPGERPMSLAAWRNQGSLTRQMMIEGIPAERAQEGMFINQNRAIPQSTLLSHAPYGQGPGGEIITEETPSKFAKRTKLYGRHPFVKAEGLNEPFTPDFPITQNTLFGRRRQTIRGAFTFGEMTGGGQGAYNPNKITGFSQPHAVDIWPRQGQENVTGLLPVGTEIPAGTPVALAEGKRGYVDKWWNTVVKGYEPITRQEVQWGVKGQPEVTVYGQRAILERRQTPQGFNPHFKLGQKAELVPDTGLGRITDAQGNLLNLDAVLPVKSVEALALQWYEQRGRAGWAEALGVPVESLAGKTYAEMQPQLLRAFKEKVIPANTMMIHRPRVMHESQLPTYQGSFVGQPTPVEGRPGFFNVVQQAPAFVGEIAGVISQSYAPGGRSFISYKDLQGMKQTQPELYRQVMAQGAGGQRAYRELIRAATASAGLEPPAENIATIPATALNEMVMTAAARARSRMGLNETELLPRGALTEDLLQVMQEKGPNKPWRIKAGGTEALLPSPKSMGYFQAYGQEEGISTSPFLNAVTDVVKAGATGEPIQLRRALNNRTEFGRNVTGYTAALQQIATGQQTIRRSMGVTVPTEGYVQHLSPLLQTGETLLPGHPGGQIVSTTRQPGLGSQTYDPRAAEVTVAPESLKALGADTSHAYRSLLSILRGGGDVDGDQVVTQMVDKAIKRGEYVQQPDGSYRNSKGVVFNDKQAIKRAAVKAVELGAGDFREDIVGYDKPVQTPEQVVSEIQQKQATGYSSKEYGAALGLSQRMAEEIGYSYNATMRGAASAADPRAAAAMEQLHLRTYNRTQRPAEPTPGMRQLQNLGRGFALGTGGVRLTGPEGGVGRLEGGNLQTLFNESLSALTRDKVPAATIAAVTADAGGGRRNLIRQAVEKYYGSDAPRSEALAALASEAQGIMSYGGRTAGENWAREGTMGRWLGGQAAMRAQKRWGKDPKALAYTLERAGMSRGLFEDLLKEGTAQNEFIESSGKIKGRTIEDVARVRQAMRARYGEGETGVPPTRIDKAIEDFKSDLGANIDAILAGGAGGKKPPSRGVAAPVEGPPEPSSSRGAPLDEEVDLSVLPGFRRGGPEGPTAEDMRALRRMDMKKSWGAKPTPLQAGPGGHRGHAAPVQGGGVPGGMGLFDPTKDYQRITMTKTGDTIITRITDTEQNALKAATAKMEAYDIGVNRALRGQPVTDEDLLAGFARADLSAGSLSDLQAVSSLAGGAAPTKATLKAAQRAAMQYKKLEQKREQLGAYSDNTRFTAGKPLASIAAQAGAELYPSREAMQAKALEDLNKNFGDLSGHVKKFSGVMEQTTKTLSNVDEYLGKSYKDAEKYVSGMGDMRKALQVRLARMKQMTGISGEAIKGLEEAGLQGQPQYGVLKQQYERGMAQKGQLEELKLRANERELEVSQGMGRRAMSIYRRRQALMTLNYLPWQMQMAQQWGTMQAQEAAQYATGVDTALQQATFASGYMPPSMGVVARSQQVAATQGWSKYYIGQGATESLGAGPSQFMAAHPQLARGVGALAPFGQIAGYGLAAEMIATTSLQRGLFTGHDAMLRTGTMGRAGGLAVAAGLGYLGANAAVNMANAVQDRQRTLGEGLRESVRTGVRGGAFLTGGVLATGAQRLAQATGFAPLDRFARGIGQTMAATTQLPESNLFYTGELEAERRDAARKESPAYLRQQAIMAALKEQGLSPEQGGAYAGAYARAGVYDPTKMAALAGQAFKLEQYAGLEAGTLAQTFGGVAGAANIMVGQRGAAVEQLQTRMATIAQANPALSTAFTAGLQAAPQQWGQGIYKLGLTGQQNLELYQRTARMQMSGSSPFEIQQFVQGTELSTPRAWSDQMRQWGRPGMAVVDALGRPANTEELRGWQAELRDLTRAHTQFGFEQQAEQIAASEDWMRQGWAIQDRVRPLSRRYRVEDADMGIRRMALRLQQAQDRAKTNLSRNLFEQQVSWREGDIGTSMARAATQREWQLQDFAQNRNVFELQRGWQMEDMDRAIRYSTGRQRILLKERRDRAVQMSNIQRERMDEGERRAGVRYGWSQEDRQKSLDRLKEESKIRREMMEKDEEMQQKSVALLKEQYDQAVKRRQELVDVIIPAEKESEDLERKKAEAALEWRKERHEVDLKYFEATQPLQDKMTKSAQDLQDAWAKWQTAMEVGVPKTAKIFIDQFGEDSDAYKAIQQWQEMLNNLAQAPQSFDVGQQGTGEHPWLGGQMGPNPPVVINVSGAGNPTQVANEVARMLHRAGGGGGVY